MYPPSLPAADYHNHFEDIDNEEVATPFHQEYYDFGQTGQIPVGQIEQSGQTGQDNLAQGNQNNRDMTPDQTLYQFTLPAGWTEDLSVPDPNEPGNFPIMTWHPPGDNRTDLCYWTRSANGYTLRPESAATLRQFLAEDPSRELRGDANERALFEVLGDGILNSVGNFETVSLHTMDLRGGQRALFLEARWTTPDPDRHSFGVFLPSPSGNSLDQAWLITDNRGNNVQQYSDLANSLFPEIEPRQR